MAPTRLGIGQGALVEKDQLELGPRSHRAQRLQHLLLDVFDLLAGHAARPVGNDAEALAPGDRPHEGGPVAQAAGPPAHGADLQRPAACATRGHVEDLDLDGLAVSRRVGRRHLLQGLVRVFLLLVQRCRLGPLELVLGDFAKVLSGQLPDEDLVAKPSPPAIVTGDQGQSDQHAEVYDAGDQSRDAAPQPEPPPAASLILPRGGRRRRGEPDLALAVRTKDLAPEVIRGHLEGPVTMKTGEPHFLSAPGDERRLRPCPVPFAWRVVRCTAFRAEGAVTKGPPV